MKPFVFSIVLLAGSTYALSQYAGINIAGFDFGCFAEGSCDLSRTVMPVAALDGPDGIGKIQHFVKDDHLNAFRLPVGWQY
jgi:endoglucanase